MVKPIDEAKLTAMFGSAEERRESHDRMARALRFVSANMQLWRQRYAEQIVVVHDEKLIAVVRDANELEDALCQLSVPRSEVLIRRVQAKGAALLPSNFQAAE